MKALGHAWHAPHNYELLKLPFEWYYLPSDWHTMFRPRPFQLHNVGWDTDLAKYDLILTHMSHHPGERGYFDRLRPLAAAAGVPLIAIMHGTPSNAAQADEFRAVVGDTMIVCNAHQSEQAWGFARSTTIIHGFDPAEWPETDYRDMRAVTSVPPITAAHQFAGYYGIKLLDEVRRRVAVTWIRKDVSFSAWDQYKEFLSHSAVYFNPTHGSPMPRARGEAMMMGLAPVTTNSMGEDRFIEDGVTGYLVQDDPDAIAALLQSLLADRDRCDRVGRAARAAAIAQFHWKRWSEEWMAVIDTEICQGRSM